MSFSNLNRNLYEIFTFTFRRIGLQAGDAASLYSQWKDTRIRMEHYDNAEEQGHIAGANMTGHWTPSNMEPHYELNLGNVLHMEVGSSISVCMSNRPGSLAGLMILPRLVFLEVLD